MSKKVWIATGIVIAAAGATAIAAHAYRGHADGGWRGGHYGHQGGYDDHGWGHRRGHRGWWRGRMSKEEFDEETRARFATMDANGDGVVDKAEVEARITKRMERHMKHRDRHHRRARMMRRFDTDGDGKITKQEVEARVTKRFARMDLDGDGKIADPDLPPMMRGMNVLSGEKASGHGMMGHRHHGRGHRMLHRLIGADADNDGAITLQELQDHAAKRFARFDRTGDGVIDQADRDAMRKEALDYRVRRFMHRFGVAPDGKLTLEQFTKMRNERFAEMKRVRGDDAADGGERGRGWGRRGGWDDRGDDRYYDDRDNNYRDDPRGGGQMESPAEPQGGRQPL